MLLVLITLPAAAAPPYLGDRGGQTVQSLPRAPRRLGFEAPAPQLAPQPVTGTANLVALMVDFTDDTGDLANDTAAYNTLLFTDASGNLVHFYKEASYNQFVLAGNVDTGGWRRSAQTMAYWGADGAAVDDANDSIALLAREAILLADTDVDYARYDSDGDSIVDYVLIFHAGNAQEFTAAGGDIYSHYGGLVGGVAVDGVTVENYLMVAENSPIGIIAHEFGHALGLPDLYNTTNGNPTCGKWDLMDQGAWAGPTPGSSPSHPSAWHKVTLGWAVPEVLNGTSSVGDSLSAWALQGDAVKLMVGDSEYFLIENRRQLGYEAWLPSKGILVWHCDDRIGDLAANDVNNGAVRRIELLEADGVETVNGDVGDPFPGTSGKTYLSDTTTPGLKKNDNNTSGARILAIASVNDTASADFHSRDITVPVLTRATPTVTTCTQAVQTVSGAVADEAETPAYLGLTVNGASYAILVTTVGGTFTLDVTLDTGYNALQLTATDSAGNSATEVWGMTLADSVPETPTGDSAGFDLTVGDTAYAIPQGSADTLLLTIHTTSCTLTLAVDFTDTGYTILARTPTAAEQATLSSAAARNTIYDYGAGAGSVVSFTVTKDTGLAVGDTTAPYDGVTLTFNYAVAPSLEDGLGIYYFDPSDSLWKEVLTVAGLAVGWPDGEAAGYHRDPAADTIAVRVAHLSIYGVFPAGVPAFTTLDWVQVFPNPFKPYDNDPATGIPWDGSPVGASGVHITGLTTNATITIYSVNGEQIARFSNVSGTGMAIWDGCNDRGAEVASGVYFIVVEGGGRRVIRPVAVIR